MMKPLVLIGLIGHCLAFSDKPLTYEYTPADVTNPRVLEQANYALQESAKEIHLRCKGAVLVEVTSAKHKLEDRFPFYGALYQIDMIIRTPKGVEKTCKVTVFALFNSPHNKGLYGRCNCG